ncbi:MAG: hypothetical protein AUJ96_03765 [Armatimonadetes bacterium CG2_30_66_41]|nr:MAG: hypothetical protein AUJ96_03765 [Armatimonadetes bacterium CG2_30_66_41]
MHLPSANGSKGVDSTPSPAANSASSVDSGASANSNSRIVRRDASTCSESVRTTMSALTGWRHEGTYCAPRGVCTSTRHTRQALYGFNPR